MRFESIDVGVLHLGGTRLPAGRRLPFGLTVTMDATPGAATVEALNLPRMIPVHFDDYGVSPRPADFVAEMKRRGIADRIIELERGAGVTFSWRLVDGSTFGTVGSSSTGEASND